MVKKTFGRGHFARRHKFLRVVLYFIVVLLALRTSPLGMNKAGDA